MRVSVLKRGGIGLVCAIVVGACPPPQGSKSPVAPAGPVAKAVPVTAIGVVTGIKNISLARQTAQQRAASNVARLLEPDALRFRYQRMGSRATLTLLFEKAGRKPPTLLDSDLERIAGGWLARVSATRSAGAAAAMAALSTERAEATVVHANPATALKLAESRALRAVIGKAVPLTKSGLRAEGTLSLVTLEQRIGKGAARVSLAAHVRLASQGPLAEEQGRAVLVAVAREHLLLGDRAGAMIVAREAGDEALVAEIEKRPLKKLPAARPPSKANNGEQPAGPR